MNEKDGLVGDRGLRAPTPDANGRVLGFAGFRRSVADLPRAIAFYRDGLGFVPEDALASRRASDADAPWPADPVSTTGPSIRLRLGAQRIELVEAGVPTPRPQPAPGEIDTGFQHLAIVAADLGAAHARLMRCMPAVLSRGGPVQLPAATGSVSAFKFLDPDGHPLELIHFPPGSGAAIWQRPAGSGPTLGIDHSAIVVADPARSIAFYRDGLGFTVDARQVNRGTEQERLDGLDRAVVDVVALRPARDATPHLELLGYRVPAPRAAAPNPHADRLLWWADDSQVIASRVGQAADGRVIELRDPDGHLHLLRSVGAR